jgi:hypothetical protein
MRRTIFTLAAAAFLTPATLSAQAQTGAAADAAAEARIQAALATAVDAGVPVTLLESKIAEGRAKGVDMARIATAVEHRAEVLTRVQTALAARFEAVTTGELTAAADAHQNGVGLDGIVGVTARAGNDRAAALTVLADLVAEGRAPEHALLRVEAALNGGAAELARLRAAAAASARAATPSVDARAGAGVEAGPAGASTRGAAGVGVRVGGGG